MWTGPGRRVETITTAAKNMSAEQLLEDERRLAALPSRSTSPVPEPLDCSFEMNYDHLALGVRYYPEHRPEYGGGAMLNAWRVGIKLSGSANFA
jgi:hypothetical protein